MRLYGFNSRPGYKKLRRGAFFRLLPAFIHGLLHFKFSISSFNLNRRFSRFWLFCLLNLKIVSVFFWRVPFAQTIRTLFKNGARRMVGLFTASPRSAPFLRIPVGFPLLSLPGRSVVLAQAFYILNKLNPIVGITNSYSW